MTDTPRTTDTASYSSSFSGSDNGDHAGVGLSDPTVGKGRRAMLDLVNKLHSTGPSDLPQIAVIGSQSAGKSSLIESISGVTLPRAAGTCTRVALRFTVDENGQALGQARIVSFGDIIYDKAEVEDRLRRAQRAILNPRMRSDHFLTRESDEEKEPEGQLTFSSNCVELRISGPEVADLSFCDLPGLIASVGRSGNSNDIALVENLVKSYIKKPSCVILLTVACETDFENQGAHRLAKENDPDGKRTVGVLTKPDRIPSGEEHHWISFIKNEKEPLEHNWFSVKQPSSHELKQGITWAEARQSENNFFSSTPPWSEMDAMYQKYLRTTNLIKRLSDILSDLVAKRLPEIHDEIEAALRGVSEMLEQLPPPPSADPRADIMRLVHAFTKAVAVEVAGVPDPDGLHQKLRPAQDTFRRAIRGSAPAFRPYERRFADERSFSAPGFLENEDEPMEEDEEGKEIFIDELPGNFPWVVKQAYVTRFTKHWNAPAYALCDAVYRDLAVRVRHLTHEHFGTFGQGLLEQRVRLLVQELVKTCLESTKHKIDWLTDLERQAFTLNTHYLADYRDKFLAHYKGARQAGEHGDFIDRIRRYVPAGEGEDAISKILSGLVELGVAGVKPEDIPKLLPPDEMEPAIEIMADVRAYFQVAYKRFVDNIPLAIDQELVYGIERDMYSALMAGLHVNGPDGDHLCREYAQESPQAASKREELEKKLERLSGASEELLNLGRS
ncbi:P-loop containing nucleoside triphosphate hydrolase protein [Schizophyllum commune]